MSRDDDLWQELHATRDWRYEQHERDAINDYYDNWRQPWWRGVWAWRVGVVVMIAVLLWAGTQGQRGTVPHYPTHQTTETTR